LKKVEVKQTLPQPAPPAIEPCTHRFHRPK
jgi:hypothetical protein